MYNGRYILEGHIPVPCEDLMEWGDWFQKADRHVAETTIKPDVSVSTVFLGLDHNHAGNGEPVLFETMVFGGENDQDMDRYSTWEEAVAGHKKMVKKISK